MKRKKIVLGILTIVVLIGAFVLFNSDGDLTPTEQKKLLQLIGEQWNLDFGGKCKVNCFESDFGGFRGEGSTYIAVKYKDKKKLSSMLAWKRMESTDISEVKSELESLEVAKEEWPLFDECTIYEKNKYYDNLYVLYNGDDYLYIIESIK